MGLSPNQITLSTDEERDVDECVARGERDFYTPSMPDIPPHRWSFLTIAFSMPINANQTDYLLPQSDFGGISGDLTYAAADNKYTGLRHVTAEKIDELRSLNTTNSSHPTRYALRMSQHGGVTRQQWTMSFWPDPDASYTVKGSYDVSPVLMSEDRQYPYGGAQFENLLLYCVLAQAELYNEKSKSKRFQQERDRQMVAAIGMNNGQNQPDILGYNGNATFGGGGRLRDIEIRDGRYFENFSPLTLDT